MAEESTYVLGVTGGMGSGKTEVCGILENLGARVFYADDEAKKLMTENLSLRRDIQTLFGAEAYSKTGELNRPYIARRVFSNPGELDKLNALVHPIVRNLFEEVKRSAARDQVGVLVREAALLPQSTEDTQVDALLVVDTPDDIRIERLLKNNKWTREQIEERMARQMSRNEYLARAEYVIENNGDKKRLREQTEKLWQSINKIHGNLN